MDIGFRKKAEEFVSCLHISNPHMGIETGDIPGTHFVLITGN